MLTCIDARTGRFDGSVPNEYRAQLVDTDEERCDFCGTPKSLCKRLVAGIKGRICDECIRKGVALRDTYMDAA